MAKATQIIKVPDNDPGKKKFNMAALSRPAAEGEVIEIGGERRVVGRRLSVREVIEQYRTFYDQIVRRVPTGVTIYWYEAHKAGEREQEHGSKRDVEGNAGTGPQDSKPVGPGRKKRDRR
jgi:hypothetical protein